MKKIFLLILLSISFYSFSQTYKYGAGFVNGIFIKSEGT
jgi:hypothetical protein